MHSGKRALSVVALDGEALPEVSSFTGMWRASFWKHVSFENRIAHVSSINQSINESVGRQIVSRKYYYYSIAPRIPPSRVEEKLQGKREPTTTRT